MQAFRKSAALCLSAAALMMMILAGCAPGGDGASDVRGITDSTIAIGTWAPLTGPAAPWGAVGRGSQLYFEMINEAGGIHGRKIVFHLRDDAYQPARTVSAVKEMVERDEVFAMVAGVGTATGMAVMDYLVEQNVPWVSPASGATHWAYPPKPAVFSTYTPYFDEAYLLTKYAVEDLGHSKIGILYQNDDFGESGVVGAEMILEEMGMELVAHASVELADSDLSSQALVMKNAGADAVLLWGTPKHAATMVGESAKIGYQPQWLGSSTLSDAPLMHQITQGLWEGTIYNLLGEFPSSDHPLVTRYREAHMRIMPDERAGTFFYSGILFAEPLAEGLRRAGRDLTVESFVAAMESLESFQGTGAPMTFTGEQHQGTRSLSIARVVSATESEVLTDWMESDLDIEAAIARLEGGI